MAHILQGILDVKVAKILQLFLNSPEDLFHISKVSTLSKVPMGSTFRIVQRLAKAGAIETIPVGKIKLYRAAKTEEMEDLRRWLATK